MRTAVLSSHRISQSVISQHIYHMHIWDMFWEHLGDNRPYDCLHLDDKCDIDKFTRQSQHVSSKLVTTLELLQDYRLFLYCLSLRYLDAEIVRAEGCSPDPPSTPSVISWRGPPSALGLSSNFTTRRSINERECESTCHRYRKAPSRRRWADICRRSLPS